MTTAAGLIRPSGEINQYKPTPTEAKKEEGARVAVRCLEGLDGHLALGRLRARDRGLGRGVVEEGLDGRHGGHLGPRVRLAEGRLLERRRRHRADGGDPLTANGRCGSAHGFEQTKAKGNNGRSAKVDFRSTTKRLPVDMAAALACVNGHRVRTRKEASQV